MPSISTKGTCWNMRAPSAEKTQDRVTLSATPCRKEWNYHIHRPLSQSEKCRFTKSLTCCFRTCCNPQKKLDTGQKKKWADRWSHHPGAWGTAPWLSGNTHQTVKTKYYKLCSWRAAKKKNKQRFIFFTHLHFCNSQKPTDWLHFPPPVEIVQSNSSRHGCGKLVQTLWKLKKII